MTTNGSLSLHRLLDRANQPPAAVRPATPRRIEGAPSTPSAAGSSPREPLAEPGSYPKQRQLTPHFAGPMPARRATSEPHDEHATPSPDGRNAPLTPTPIDTPSVPPAPTLEAIATMPPTPRGFSELLEPTDAEADGPSPETQEVMVVSEAVRADLTPPRHRHRSAGRPQEIDFVPAGRTDDGLATQSDSPPPTPQRPAPPVVIGRIEVQVRATTPEHDPFSGCRALEEGGVAVPRGAGW